MFQLDYDFEKFEKSLRERVKIETTLNKAIQYLLKPEIIFYQNMDQSLRKVGSHTIQTLCLSSVHRPECKTMKEITFVKGAPVSENFEATIKCFRIKKPNVIQLEGKGLRDLHITLLIDFLRDMN